MKLVNVRFNETAILSKGRVFAYREEGVISEEDAERLGSTVEVLGPANEMFSENPAQSAAEDAAQDEAPAEPSGPADKESPQDEPDQKDAEAPENKMVGDAPEKKSKK